MSFSMGREAMNLLTTQVLAMCLHFWLGSPVKIVTMVTNTAAPDSRVQFELMTKIYVQTVVEINFQTVICPGRVHGWLQLEPPLGDHMTPFWYRPT